MKGSTGCLIVVMVLAVVLPLGAVVGLSYLWWSSRETTVSVGAGAAASANAERARLEDEAAKHRAQLREEQKKVEALLVQLANANDEATRSRLQKELHESQRRVGSITYPKADGGTRGRPKSHCAPGDPLCDDP